MTHLSQGYGTTRKLPLFVSVADRYGASSTAKTTVVVTALNTSAVDTANLISSTLANMTAAGKVEALLQVSISAFVVVSQASAIPMATQKILTQKLLRTVMKASSSQVIIISMPGLRLMRRRPNDVLLSDCALLSLISFHSTG